MSWRTLLGLVLCNAIWSSNPVAGKLLMREMIPLHASWMRYFLAWCCGLVLFIIIGIKNSHLLKKQTTFPALIPWTLLAGFITFFISPYSQYAGLGLSTATANSLIVAMEPLFAVFLAWLLLDEHFKKKQIIAFSIALIGFCLLSNIHPLDLMGSIKVFNMGNILILISMPAEAMYTIISRKLAGKIPPFTLMFSSLTFGFFLFTAFLLLQGYGLPALHNISLTGWLSALWLGSLGTTLGYLYWSIALEKAPVAAVSLTLFVQPITGSLISWFFLGEKLELWQYSGGLFILAALFIQTIVKVKKNEI